MKVFLWRIYSFQSYTNLILSICLPFFATVRLTCFLTPSISAKP